MRVGWDSVVKLVCFETDGRVGSRAEGAEEEKSRGRIEKGRKVGRGGERFPEALIRAQL